MNNQTLSKIFTFSELMIAPEPKLIVTENLIKLLKNRLAELKIIWNPDNFRQGLSNPRMPKWLLEKLENLLIVAEASNWKISNALALEIDETVEDIESFNPAYRAALKKEKRDALRDIRLGRVASVEAIKSEVRSRKR